MKQHGFTLMELLVTMAIIAILAAVAIPSYLDYVRKSRRSEAMSALLSIANAQQKYLLNNNATTSDLGLLGIAATTESGAYALSIAGGSAIAATTGGGAQANDTECKSFSLDLATGEKGSAGTSGANTEPGTCWPE